MTEILAGLFWLYVPIGAASLLLWLWPIRRLIGLWVGRDVMLSFIPTARAVHHTERILRVVKREP